METTDYVSYPIALALKKAGFDWKCDHYYNGHGNLNHCADTDRINRNTNGHHTPSCSAPHIYYAQKWLREKRRFQCQVLLNGVRSMFFWQVREMIGNGRHAESTHQYDVYEDAMSDCIAAALELIEKK